jgi:hypothetical protein
LIECMNHEDPKHDVGRQTIRGFMIGRCGAIAVAGNVLSELISISIGKRAEQQTA